MSCKNHLDWCFTRVFFFKNIHPQWWQSTEENRIHLFPNFFIVLQQFLIALLRELGEGKWCVYTIVGPAIILIVGPSSCMLANCQLWYQNCCTCSIAPRRIPYYKQCRKQSGSCFGSILPIVTIKTWNSILKC